MPYKRANRSLKRPSSKPRRRAPGFNITDHRLYVTTPSKFDSRKREGKPDKGLRRSLREHKKPRPYYSAAEPQPPDKLPASKGLQRGFFK
ncbi:hypothetical protein ABBQ38_010421 [Trebouxia sp. C0009 RCD-2024]